MAAPGWDASGSRSYMNLCGVIPLQAIANHPEAFETFVSPFLQTMFASQKHIYWNIQQGNSNGLTGAIARSIMI